MAAAGWLMGLQETIIGIGHKTELTEDELLMLAMAAAQAALARYWHPGETSAEETLAIIGQILDHDETESCAVSKNANRWGSERSLPEAA